MYIGGKWFSLQVLLYQIAAVILYNLRLRLLYSSIVFASLAHKYLLCHKICIKFIEIL